MIRIVLFLCFSLSLCFTCVQIQAQEAYGQIDEIVISGNKITRQDIVLNEISLQPKDSLPLTEIESRLQKSKENLNNTGLFNFVELTLDSVSGHTGHYTLSVALTERWYIWPSLFLDVDDRNFNTWWQTKDYNRLRYGVAVDWQNFRGANERLTLFAIWGFIRRFGFQYRTMNLNQTKTLGLQLGASFFQTKQIVYKTQYDDRVVSESPLPAREDWVSKIGVLHRIQYRTEQFFELRHARFRLNDSLAHLAPSYLGAAAKQQDFLGLIYVFKWDHRDQRAYPLNGHFFKLDLVHYANLGKTRGQTTFAIAEAKKFWKHSNRIYSGIGLTLKDQLWGQLPYIFQEGLGYTHYVRGHELNVIDGQGFLLLKSNVKYEWLKPKTFKLPWVPLEQFSKIHLAAYCSPFFDLGFVRSNFVGENTLPNTWMWGAGLGLDFITYYDKVLRIELSLNHQHETGIFLHFSQPI